MATKDKTYKTFDHYYDKLSKKLIDKKYFFYLNPGINTQDKVFYSEEIFLLALLNEVFAHVAGEESFMFYVLSNPSTYSLMLFNKYLKEQGKMDTANEVLDSLFHLEQDIVPLRTIKESYDTNELVESYNKSIKKLIEIESKLAELEKGFNSYLKEEKTKKGKDFYIG